MKIPAQDLEANGSILPLCLAGPRRSTPAIGLIDTAAGRTLIRQGIAARLGLQMVGQTRAKTPPSVSPSCHPDYIISVASDPALRFNVAAIEMPLNLMFGDVAVDCLSGRETSYR
jgi:hypothetical protein